MAEGHEQGATGATKGGGGPRPVVRIRLGAAKPEATVGTAGDTPASAVPMATTEDAVPEAPPVSPVRAPQRPWPRAVTRGLVALIVVGVVGAAAFLTWHARHVAITPDVVEVPGEGGAYKITVETRRAWAVEGAAPDWVVVDTGQGRGDGAIGVVVAPNPTLLARVAELRVGGRPHRIAQEAGEPFLRLTPARAEVKAEGGKYQVEVNSNQPWRVQAATKTDGAAWHAVSVGMGQGDGRFEVEVQANPSEAARTMEWVVGGQRHVLVQAGVPRPTAEQVLAEIDAALAAADWPRAMAKAVELRKTLDYDLEKWRRVAARVVGKVNEAAGKRDWLRPSELGAEVKGGLAALAEQGSAEASLAAALAHLWYRDLELLECAPVDRPRIAGWLREAARAGLGAAHFHHGEFARSQETDAVQAYRHFYQGHLAKDADATARVAYFLLHGADPGAEAVAEKTFAGLWPKRVENGVRLAREAAERGSARATYYLGVHEWQQAKTEAQNRAAVARLVRAADLGHPGAVAELRDSVLRVKPELIGDEIRRRLNF